LKDTHGRYSVETGQYDAGQYTSRSKVYEDIQEYRDNQERQKLHDEIKRHWGYTPMLSLDQLRRIHAIIKEI
jgi:hypothetical protein